MRALGTRQAVLAGLLDLFPRRLTPRAGAPTQQAAAEDALELVERVVLRHVRLRPPSSMIFALGWLRGRGEARRPSSQASR
jgi:hypothetical protein